MTDKSFSANNGNAGEQGDSSDADFVGWLGALQRQLMPARHRAALVVSGERAWGRALAARFIQALAGDPGNDLCLYVSDQLSHALPTSKARTQLGREYQGLVFDAYDDFDVDAFAAISGTLCGGGLLLLLLPDDRGGQWPSLARSRFLQRVLASMQNHPAVYVLHQGMDLPEMTPTPGADRRINRPVAASPFASIEQQQVVERIEYSIMKRRQLPVVLVSDRGRGKSSALGLAAARLLGRGVNTILVTAPRLATSEPLFQHARAQLPEAVADRGELRLEAGSIRFLAPDALLLEKPAADVLLVDEAAAIPLSLLQQFLQQYEAVVFATTVHGYEGTGRGFALKFNRMLDASAADWQMLNMQTPVRWGRDDPLEQWLDRLLCMDAELPNVSHMGSIDAQQCRVEQVDRDALLGNETQLSALFALLVFAHYRTRPSDLKHLLDDDQQRLYTLKYRHEILGALLVNQEGGFDEALCAAIYRGDRRPVGHLLPQTLCFHGGQPDAARFNYARIMRIAIHPSLQGQGLGSLLLQRVVELEQQQDVVAIGTSFGASAELLRFWERDGFVLLRMGFSRDHVSGSHSAVMLRPFTAAGHQLCDQIRARFRRYLASWLQGPLADFPAELKAILQQQQLQDSNELSAEDRRELDSCVHSHRGLDSCLWPLLKLVKQYPHLLEGLEPVEQQLVRGRLLHNRSLVELAKHCDVTGKSQAGVLLKRAIGKMLQALEA
jgi:tRNA(Met) cytidine acetyltransferase